MSDDNITQLLDAACGGESEASEEVLRVIYNELKTLARSRLKGNLNGSLVPTALVHEAYMRLIGPEAAPWNGRQHFFRAAAKAMRHILVDRARHRSRQKRGEGVRPVTLDIEPESDGASPESLIALDEALKSLESMEPRSAQVVNLRYFAGLTIDETASALEIAPATVERDWQFARAWLYRELRIDGDD